MSEFINNRAPRREALADFTRELIKGGNGKTLITKYKLVLETVTPEEAMQVLDQMLTEGFPNEKVKANVGKIINTFYKSLNSHFWEKPKEPHFLSLLMSENRGVEQIMTNIKMLVKSIFSIGIPDKALLLSELQLQITKMKLYELHYIKKENILFPYIEKAFPQFRCLQLMWSFHDDFRRSIKNIELILSVENPDLEQLSKELGTLFFVVLRLYSGKKRLFFR